MRDENICKAIKKYEKELNDTELSLTEAQRFFNNLNSRGKADWVWHLYVEGYLKI